MVTNGSDELRNRLLRRAFTGEDACASCSTEPGGFDLAGLATWASRR